MSVSVLVVLLLCCSLCNHAVVALALNKQSTALDVLKELNQASQLAPYILTTTPSSPEVAEQPQLQQPLAVVTGGNSGIGLETVKTLALAGMTVILCARDLESAQKVVSEEIPVYLQPSITPIQLDLADLTSVQAAVESIQNLLSLGDSNAVEEQGRISVLVNNAGVMAPPQREVTKQNVELQFGTNHIGHHYWTRQLLPLLAPNGRIVTVASEAHRIPTTAASNNRDSGTADGGIDWQSSKYSPWGAYGQSKLANVLFAKRLQEKLIQEGRSDVTSVALHPGVIGTNLWRYTLPAFLQPVSKLFADKTTEQGAATTVYCVLAKTVLGGAYYDNCQPAKPTDTAEDVQLRKELWEYTEALLKEKGFGLAEGPLMENNDVVGVAFEEQEEGEKVES